MPTADLGQFRDVRTSQNSVTLVVAVPAVRARIDLILKIIFNIETMDSDHTFALADLPEGEAAFVHALSLDTHVTEHLMNLGFIPGVEIMPARSAPGGDPRVYRVDGCEVAVRREVSRKIAVRRHKAVK